MRIPFLFFLLYTQKGQQTEKAINTYKLQDYNISIACSMSFLMAHPPKKYYFFYICKINKIP